MDLECCLNQEFHTTLASTARLHCAKNSTPFHSKEPNGLHCPGRKFNQIWLLFWTSFDCIFARNLIFFFVLHGRHITSHDRSERFSIEYLYSASNLSSSSHLPIIFLIFVSSSLSSVHLPLILPLILLSSSSRRPLILLSSCSSSSRPPPSSSSRPLPSSSSRPLHPPLVLLVLLSSSSWFERLVITIIIIVIIRSNREDMGRM
jgi:hypothetical protein